MSSSDTLVLGLQAAGVFAAIVSGWLFEQFYQYGSGAWISMALISMGLFITAGAWMVRGLLFEMFRYLKEHR